MLETLGHDEAAQLATSLGLTLAELGHIERTLGRLPKRTEIAVFAGMWSEHCAYKSTKHLLATLPVASRAILAGPGSHAGVVDVGEGWGVAFKIESHNHPSAVDPYQGAATGVGGILRDIIAQGARPCAIMDSLCFGLPDQGRNSHLASGVVAGVAGYGNAIGVANVGGKTVYDRRYEGNPLVNALAAGMVRHDGMRTARATGIGNAVLYVGAATGRDGVLGAAFASEELAADNVQSRPHVQVGDPFAGKKLLEACLAFTADLGMVACQDMGACGITCGTMEMAAAGNVGMDIDLGTIPLREAAMTPQEILLSESQERFLFVVACGQEAAALAHFQTYGVHSVVCGRVVGGTHVQVRYRDVVYVDLPAQLVAGGAPAVRWPVAAQLPALTPYPDFAVLPIGPTLLNLLADPNIASPQAITQRYDQTVGNRTVHGPGGANAAVLQLPDTRRGFALTISGCGAACANAPYEGTQAALATACRDLACVGAALLAITDGLNMASPRDPVEMLKITEVIRGLKDGLETLGIAVTGGNVSLYNESPAGPIPPTPMVGAIGLVADVGRVPRRHLVAGDVVFLVGRPQNTLSFSHFARLHTGVQSGAAPAVDLSAEKQLADFMVQNIRAQRIQGTRSIGMGGLAVSLAKMCIGGGCGVHVQLPPYTRTDWALFGEYPAMVWVACAAQDVDALAQSAQERGVLIHRAGVAGARHLVIEGACNISMETLADAYVGALTRGLH